MRSTWWRIVVWVVIHVTVRADLFTTLPQFDNPVRSGMAAASANAVPAPGAVYTATNRPADGNPGRYRVDSWRMGLPISSAPPDFNIGDVILPPPMANLSIAPTVITTNGAFFMATRRTLIAAQPGACTVSWNLTDGSTRSITYTIGGLPTLGASRLFWTDNFIAGGVNTNIITVPDFPDFAVSLSGRYAKIHYNTVIPDFDPGNSQATPSGQSNRSRKAGQTQDLPAVWIDENDLLRARNQTGFLILEYFDTSSLETSVGYEVVYVAPAKVYRSNLLLGERVLPSEGAAVADGLIASLSKSGNYIIKWTTAGSHFENQLFAVGSNATDDMPAGDPSKAQILWQRKGVLDVLWPYEFHWYGTRWPGDSSANLFVFDPANPSSGPPIRVATNHTATVVWSESGKGVMTSTGNAGDLQATGEGRALVQYQNGSDVWFFPVRTVARTNGAYLSNEEAWWPVGVPLQPVGAHPRPGYDGVSNYLSFYSDIPAGFSAELWIHPSSTTASQGLLQILDYPQQSTIQASLSLSGGFLRASVLTNSTSSSAVVTGTNPIPAGVWTHVAMTKDSSGAVRIYVNGRLDGSMTVSRFNATDVGKGSFGQIQVGKSAPAMGAVASVLAMFTGDIREIRLWDSALSAGTIQSRQAAVLTGSELGLMHLITTAWEEASTSYQRWDGSSYQVLDLVTGELVDGFGTASTTGTTPYALGDRLALGGTGNWAELPVTWNRTDNRTVELWFQPGSGDGWQSLVAGVNGSTTNWQVGILDGHLAFGAAGVPLSVALVPIHPNSSDHLAIAVTNGQAGLYLNGASVGTFTLPAAGVTADRLVVGAGTLLNGAVERRFKSASRKDLKNPAFDFSKPAGMSVLGAWEAPQNVDDDYARQIRSLFIAPVTGNYIFYLASDDDSDLYLSADTNPLNRRLIAYQSGWTPANQWGAKNSSTRSDTIVGTITLEAGKAYYMEQIHHEGAGGDHASVTYTVVSAGEVDPVAGTSTRIRDSLLQVPQGASPIEVWDLRVYSGCRSADQIATDRISSVQFTDADLVRHVNFDRVSPGKLDSGESVMWLPDDARGYQAIYHGTPSKGSSIGLPAPEVLGGMVRSGTAYHPGIYQSEGRIIPVNSIPGGSAMEVWWLAQPSAPFLDAPLRIPSGVNRYRIMDPVYPSTLVVAGQDASGFIVPDAWQDAGLYFQNDPGAVGFNPNEEHALLMGGRSVYAMRWDLNSDSTSHNYVLLQYRDSNKGMLSGLEPIRVIPTNAVYPDFNRRLLVGQLLQAPKPLVDLPPCAASGPLAGEDPLSRLYQDRRYRWWARSASTNATPDSVPCRWYYPMQDGFFWPASLGQKRTGDPVPFGNTSNGMSISYTIQWPDVVPVLALGQTLSDAVPSAVGDGFLPAVSGQKSVEILFDEAAYGGRGSAVLLDPATSSTASLNSVGGMGVPTDVRLGKTYFPTLPPHLRDRVYWDPIAKTVNLEGGIVRPVTGFPYVLPAWLGSKGSTNTDYYALMSLSGDSGWQSAVSLLRRNATVVTSAETPFTELVLSPTGKAGGRMTLGMNTRRAFNDTGDPVVLYPIRVDPTILYPGTALVIYSDNKFDEYTTLRHSGDFGGAPDLYEFDWRYSSPEEGQAPASSPATWISYMPVTSGLNRVIFGGPGIQTLKDQYFSCRWRCVAAGAPNTNWSAWTAPAFVQSWLTRAMDGINPFEQRLSSLANNHVDLKTSILSQAGKRFVGAIPLNMDNAVDYGLIETYETLLQQARNLSIDAGYSDTDVNASLLDAASKLNELYMMLGDEALSDAKDPTIAWGSRDLNDQFFGSRASSLFAFQGIVPSLLEEELALLRGIDDTTSTPVTTYPVYNRLYWNFTKGINSGEPAYALNYAIPSLVGDEMGSITEADAAILYPQGHGDAYGHYLTALKEYYRLLNNANFTWIPRAEVKSIGGVNVTFDYVDERKMASTALSLAKTALEIVDRTFRRDYRTDPASRVNLLRDTNDRRAWSATDWDERASQGVLYHWMTLNSLLPAAGPADKPQTISRGTVPELAELAGMVGTLQDRQDDIDRGDSPMGVDANVVPFDLDPIQVDAGRSHFDQVYERALGAMQSAYLVYQRAGQAAANLRRQEVSLESFRQQVDQREDDFNQRLIDLYGTPYPDDIGPTGAYKTGYSGPDLYHYNYIDRDLFDPANEGAVREVTFQAEYRITGDSLDTLTSDSTPVTYQINSEGIPVVPSVWTGQRAVYGKIQTAQGDYIRSWIGVRAALAKMNDHKSQMELRLQRLRDHNQFSDYYGAIDESLNSQKDSVDLAIQKIEETLGLLDGLDAEIQAAYQASKDPMPESFVAGLANGGDLSFTARAVLAVTELVGEENIAAGAEAATYANYALGMLSESLDSRIGDNQQALADAEEQSQTAYECNLLLSQLNSDKDSIYGAVVAMRQAWQGYVGLVSKGNRIQKELLTFRQANASRIQEARYADVVFRVFKNEDLEQYLNAFEQASRYVYAAARVYDYETGLLDPTVVSGREGDFIGETMRATQLGDMVAGQPVLGSASAGTLASVMARMKENWTVLKGRFGINNPTRDTHRISLRQELFRIGKSTDPVVEANNLIAWQNQLFACRVADIRSVPEFKTFAQYYAPMGTNEPAIVCSFGTEITAGRNLFGLPLSGGDVTLDSAQFTTKIRGAAVGFEGYSAKLGTTLTRTPRVYLIPAGMDRQRMPLSGGLMTRSWKVVDQVWPIPHPAASGNVTVPMEGFGTENVHVIRRFPPMRAYDDDLLGGTGAVPLDSRLIGRSAWNTQWVLIIPGSALSSSPSAALDSLIENITDIHLVLQTYSYSGN